MSDQVKALKRELARIREQNSRLKQRIEVMNNKLFLVQKNGRIFATKSGEFVGMIVNSVDGGCKECPQDDPSTFARVFDGNGDVYHQHDNPPNPFFLKDWGQIFENPELLPTGTQNIFIDQDFNCRSLFDAIPVTTS